MIGELPWGRVLIFLYVVSIVSFAFKVLLTSDAFALSDILHYKQSDSDDMKSGVVAITAGSFDSVEVLSHLQMQIKFL